MKFELVLAIKASVAITATMVIYFGICHLLRELL